MPTPLINFATSTDLSSDLRKIYGDFISSYEDMKSFILGERDQRQAPAKKDTLIPEVLRAPLLANAEYTHARLDAHNLLSSVDDIDYPLYQIGGTNFPTTEHTEYFSHIYCALTAGPSCNKKYTLTHVNIRGANGDGVVPIESALFEGTSTSYVFDIGKYNEDNNYNISHGDLMEAKPIRDLIASIVRRSTSTSSYIKASRNPIEEGTVYRFGTHSPVTLDAYDLSGRHTGKVKNTIPGSDLSFVQAEIPNSIYEEIGDETYITIKDPRGILKFKIDGLDAGTFAFDAVVLHGNGPRHPSDTGKTEVLFQDIPIQAGSRGEVNFDASSPAGSALSMDDDGDGVIDSIIPNQASSLDLEGGLGLEDDASERNDVSGVFPKKRKGAHRRTPEYLQYIKDLFSSLLNRD